MGSSPLPDQMPDPPYRTKWILDWDGMDFNLHLVKRGMLKENVTAPWYVASCYSDVEAQALEVIRCARGMLDQLHRNEAKDKFAKKVHARLGL